MFKKFKKHRKAVSNIQLDSLIAVYDKAVKLGMSDPLRYTKASGEWLLSTSHAKRRFMFWISIENLKARVCADVVELAVIAERVHWKEVQLWRS